MASSKDKTLNKYDVTVDPYKGDSKTYDVTGWKDVVLIRHYIYYRTRTRYKIGVYNKTKHRRIK